MVIAMPTTRTQLSRTEAAALLGIGKQTLWRWIQAGKIPATKMPGVTGVYMIDRKVVDKILREKEQEKQAS